LGKQENIDVSEDVGSYSQQKRWKRMTLCMPQKYPRAYPAHLLMIYNWKAWRAPPYIQEDFG
jgi:hypothetical protein